MKTFTLKADITFKAQDLNDAFEQLSNHFECLYSFNGYPLEFTGELNLQTKEVLKDISPNFAAEVDKFYFDLAEKQQSLSDPFEKVLIEHLHDFYSTNQK